MKKKEDLRKDYVFILQHKEYFQEYFDLLGYELKINENSGVIGLVNYNGTGRLRLKKIESILLLIFRLLYIEKRKELGLHDDVVILAEEIHEKYGMLKINAKPNLDKTSYVDTLKIFKRYNLISIIDTDITKADARIKIYPSIHFAVSVDNIDELYENVGKKLRSYRTGGEKGYDDEEIDED